MKKIMVSALLCALAAPAYAGDFHAAANLGVSNWGTDVNDDFNVDGSLSGGSFDQGSLSGGIRLGYQINPHVAAEIGYHSLGKSSYEGSSVGGSFLCEGPVDAEVSGSALDATLVGILPVVGGFNLIGRVGLARWDSEASLDDSCGSLSNSESGVDPTFGLGIQIEPGDSFAFRVEAQQFRNVADEYDVNLFSVGFLAHF